MSFSVLFDLSVLIPTTVKWDSHNSYFMGCYMNSLRVYAVTDIQDGFANVSFSY